MTKGILCCDESKGLQPQRHDCAYIKMRNSLIPSAIEYANELHKRSDMMEEPSRRVGDNRSVTVSLWSRAFMARMDELVKSFRTGGSECAEP